MNIIAKINIEIEKEIASAQEMNPQIVLGMMQIQNTINEMEEAKTRGLISDGSHTFNELYHHRMVLFAVICNVYKEYAWKSWKHHDNTMYDDFFIVGINTPQGQYSYHYHKDNWDYFDVIEKPNAPQWDGHQPCDVERLLSLNSLFTSKERRNIC